MQRVSRRDFERTILMALYTVGATLIFGATVLEGMPQVLTTLVGVLALGFAMGAFLRGVASSNRLPIVLMVLMFGLIMTIPAYQEQFTGPFTAIAGISIAAALGTLWPR